LIPDAQITLRNVWFLATQRGFYFIIAFLFALLVPRMMGPKIFGQYALVTSLALWFTVLSTTGFTQVIGRFVPHLALSDQEAMQRFLGTLLAWRLAAGILAATLYVVFGLLWLHELDFLVLVIMAGIVFIRAVSTLIFAIFLGLNKAALWGLGENMRGWISLTFLLAGFYLAGLRGACLGLLFAELALLALALQWARPYLCRPGFWLDRGAMASYFRFGLIFFASQLLQAAFNNGGEALVRAVSGDYIQVSYYGLSFSIFIAIALIISQFTMAFAPMLGILLSQGDTEAVNMWAEKLVKWFAMGGVVVFFSILLLGDDLVSLVLGGAYRPVAASLLPMMLSLFAQALINVGCLLALIFDRPRQALYTSGIGLIAFCILGIPSIARWGSLGGCIAMLAASVLSAVYLTFRMREVARYSLAKYAVVIGLGSLFLPLWWVRSSWLSNVALYAAFVIAYGALLFLLRVITPNEIAAGWRAIHPKSLAVQQRVP
jgi:O-antigen/teichoic acid export membrane protein